MLNSSGAFNFVQGTPSLRSAERQSFRRLQLFYAASAGSSDGSQEEPSDELIGVSFVGFNSIRVPLGRTESYHSAGRPLNPTCIYQEASVSAGLSHFPFFLASHAPRDDPNSRKGRGMESVSFGRIG